MQALRRNTTQWSPLTTPTSRHHAIGAWLVAIIIVEPFDVGLSHQLRTRYTGPALIAFRQVMSKAGHSLLVTFGHSASVRRGGPR
jgi:hypothetical protein